MTAALFAASVFNYGARAAIRATVRDRRYSRLVKLLVLALIACAGICDASAQSAPIARPPAGKLYHGFFYDGPKLNEHDVTPEDVARYEQALGKKTTWVFFSDNWFESREFPAEMCEWIRGLSKIPYVRLMLRSDVEQNRPEKTFSIDKIMRGEFDEDLRRWARAAKSFASPILIEWGVEPNGDWFSWNGKWNGGAKAGPARYVAAYHHIVDLMRAEGAKNLQWVWHVNWFDEPEAKWNRFENYYVGDAYCDWIGLSAYGPLTPTTRDGTESLRFKMQRGVSAPNEAGAGQTDCSRRVRLRSAQPARRRRCVGEIRARRLIFRSLAGGDRVLLVE